MTAPLAAALTVIPAMLAGAALALLNERACTIHGIRWTTRKSCTACRREIDDALTRILADAS